MKIIIITMTLTMMRILTLKISQIMKIIKTESELVTKIVESASEFLKKKLKVKNG